MYRQRTNYERLFIFIPSVLLPKVLFKMGRYLNVQTGSDTSGYSDVKRLY